MFIFVGCCTTGSARKRIRELQQHRYQQEPEHDDMDDSSTFFRLMEGCVGENERNIIIIIIICNSYEDACAGRADLESSRVLW